MASCPGCWTADSRSLSSCRAARPAAALRGNTRTIVRLLLAVSLAALGLGLHSQARRVIDSAGRVVEIPGEVNRVFAAGPPASILVYAPKPESLLGWPRALRDYEKLYVAGTCRGLPETGRTTGRGGEANIERVLLLNSDLIIDFGSVRDTTIDLANWVQEQTGIPYILVDGPFEETAASYRRNPSLQPELFRSCSCAGGSLCIRWVTRRQRPSVWRQAESGSSSFLARLSSRRSSSRLPGKSAGLPSSSRMRPG